MSTRSLLYCSTILGTVLGRGNWTLFRFGLGLASFGLARSEDFRLRDRNCFSNRVKVWNLPVLY